MFFGDWSDAEDVLGDFKVSQAERDGVEILCGQYDDPYGYSGRASVLFQKDGKLFEVYGSHCSCYGLEDQWSPEETVHEELRARAERELAMTGDDGDCYYDYWRAVISVLDGWQWRSPVS